MKVCSICFKEKDLEEFSSRGSRCKPCHREYTRQHYKDNKQYYLDKAKVRGARVFLENRERLIAYLREHSCIDCSNNDIEVLTFDHVDETTKVGSISNMLHCSWTKIEKEISKCVVRCANCHMKRTRRQFGHWIDVEILDGSEPNGEGPVC